ncbi:MAG: tyrosine-type recombinase/integrase, partial [Ignavibacteriales bacterium]
VEVSTPNGKKIKRSIGKVGEMTKAVAREVELDLKHKAKLGRWDMIQNIPTFNEFIADFIEHQKNIKRNRDWYRPEHSVRLFAKYFGDKKLSEITPNDIDDYKRLRLGEGKQPSTVNRELAAVRTLFFLAKKRKRFFGENAVSEAGLMPVNNQKERILTIEEEDLLLANAEEPLKSMIRIALLTGLKVNSIRTLAWKCIDSKTNTITIESTYSKNKKPHIIPMSTDIRKLLIETKMRCGSSEYVFPAAMALARNTIGMQFKRLCKKLGIKGIRFHDLRHTAATRMVESDVSIDKVSKILGHSSIQMTMRYSHPDNSLREAVETLANFRSSTTNIATREDFDDAK